MNEFFIGVRILLAQLIEACMFIQASRGGGKSFLLRNMNETFSGHVQQIIIDLEGEFLSLREKFPFALLSVEGGDIPLNVKHAGTYAKKFMESQMSVIIDLSDLVPGDREIFVRDFLHALMNLPKNLYHPLLLYIDEVAKFCPQDEDALSTNAVIDVAARGRKRDIGVILATQRISNVHKSLTSEMGNKMIGRTFQDIDQVRAGKQLGWKPSQSTALRSLKPGEFYCFGPALQDEIIKFKVPPVVTNHKKMSSRTMAPPTPKEIQEIITSLGDLPEEAENDLKTIYGLQEEVKRLNHLIVHSGKSPISALETVNRIKEPLQKEIERLKGDLFYSEETNVRQEKILDLHRDFVKVITHAADAFHTLGIVPFIVKGDPDKKGWLQVGEKLSFPGIDVAYPYTMGPEGKIEKNGDIIEMPLDQSEKKEKPWTELVVTGTEDLTNREGTRIEPPIGKMGKTMLSFLFMFDAGFTDYQLATGCDYTPSSGSFKDALRQLKRLGYVLGDKDDLTANLETKKEVSNIIILPIRTRLTSAAYWDKLGAMEKNIASYIHMSHTNYVTPDMIAEACKYSPNSGSFKDAIRNLIKLELIVRNGVKITKNPDVPIV